MSAPKKNMPATRTLTPAAATIDYVTQENEGLKEKVKDDSSIKKQLEAVKLKQENEQLRQFISKIPPEVRREIQRRQTPQKGRAERD